MSLDPTPATNVARSPTASTTTRIRSKFSSSVVVADSPVVPLMIKPSCAKLSTRWAAKRWAPSRSTRPSACIGVIIAVNITPKGWLVVLGPGMGEGYRQGATRPAATNAACVRGINSAHFSSYFSATISISRCGYDGYCESSALRLRERKFISARAFMVT